MVMVLKSYKLQAMEEYIQNIEIQRLMAGTIARHLTIGTSAEIPRSL